MNTDFKDNFKPGSEEKLLLGQIDLNTLPAHVAVIMDGNGRWAKQRGLQRLAGHREGSESARVIVECAVRLGIKVLTVFAFSSENWRRSVTEVNALMNMLYDNLVQQKQLLIENQIRLNVLGEISRLPKKLNDRLNETIKLSAKHQGMQLNLALNYGSRAEILNAVKHILADKIPPRQISEKLFKKYLYTHQCPDPDLLIRTSGELRISNFLLFQIAYSELYFSDILWPDFREKEFFKAIIDFQKRDRRFGKV